jgi:hypothetical protein
MGKKYGPKTQHDEDPESFLKRLIKEHPQKSLDEIWALFRAEYKSRRSATWETQIIEYFVRNRLSSNARRGHRKR